MIIEHTYLLAALSAAMRPDMQLARIDLGMPALIRLKLADLNAVERTRRTLGGIDDATLAVVPAEPISLTSIGRAAAHVAATYPQATETYRLYLVRATAADGLMATWAPDQLVMVQP